MTTVAETDSLAAGEALEFPASVAQEAFFYLDQVEPGATPFNVPVRFSLEGLLDVGLLELALCEVMRRHESLRTCFEARGGSLFQVVWPDPVLDLRVVDLIGLAEGERNAELLRLGRDEARWRFDMRKLPLLRALLVKLGETSHVLHVTVHHAVADGWSIGLLAREIGEFYSGRGESLPELAIQYADYSLWQREQLTSPAMAEHLAWWRARLGDYRETELPGDFPRPPAKKWNGDIVSFEISAELAERLKRLAAENGATLFHVFLATFQILIRRISGASDIAVGTPVAGRDRPELEGLVGTFINTVLVRSELAGNPPFRDFLRRVREESVEVMERRDLPFDMLVRELRSERHAGRNPITQINYTHQRDFVRAETFGGVTLTAIPSVSGDSIFDLHFFTVEREGVWRVSCDYCTDLFERTTAERWLRQFRQLLEEAVRDPGCGIDDLDLCDEEEIARLREWGSRVVAYPRERSIGELFEEVAEAFREKAALVQDGVTLSYGEVKRRASAVAVALGEVNPGSPIGVCADSSMEALVGVLGILLAGGAYVPLDPGWPRERMEFLLRDAGVGVVVVRGGVRADFGDCRVVPVPESGVDESVRSRVGPLDPAYVLYTSGSTGQPKGVVVPHRAVVRLVRGTDYMEFRSDEVFLQAAPLTFDASTFEIWGALLNGATLVVPPPGAFALDRIARSVREEGVTTLWLTAGLFQTMVDEHLEDLGGVRNLLAGGDVLSIPHLRRVLAAQPWTRVVNGYGPTENTTFTTCHTIVREDLDRVSVPIGRPIANTSVLVLDDRGRMVATGIPGELYAGGDGLALGYLNDPAQTAACFSADFYPGVGRLYRTGDLVRWRGDGSLEFLGRADRQVKVRGVRVEPGEVEAVLMSHPCVAEAHVGIRGRGASSKTLVAWVRVGSEVDTEALMEFLSVRLPAFLRPDALVIVERFPMTASGKLDWERLPSPEAFVRTRSGPAETATEKRLAGIWQELLGVESPGRDDSFFHLGGHSLLALTLFSRIHREFGLTLPLATLLKAPTLRMLGSLIDRELGGGTTLQDNEARLSVIHAEGNRVPLVCIHGGDGGILIYKEMARLLSPDRPVLGIESPALRAGGRGVVSSIEETAARYLSALRRRQPEGPYVLCGYSYGGLVAYEMALRLQREGSSVGMLALFDTAAPGAELVRAGFVERLRRHWDVRQARDIWSRVRATVEYFVVRGAARVAPSRAEVSGDQAETLRDQHARSMQAYVPGVFPGAVTLFRAEDHGGRVFDLAEDMGWRRLVGELEIVSIPGSHLSVFEPENLGAFAIELQKRLGRVP